MAWLRRFAAEVAIFAHAWRGLRAAALGVKPSGLTYTEQNFVGMLGIVMLVAVVPDTVMRHLMVPRAYEWVNGIVDVGEAAGTLWICGAFGTMAALPHAIGSRRVTLRAGALGSVQFERGTIAAAVPVGPGIKLRTFKRLHPEAAFLCVPGGRIVRIELTEPAIVHRYPFVQPQTATTLYVSSDRPSEFCALLRSSRVRTPSARTALTAESDTPTVL